jgi:hypothetical protein
VQEEEEEGADSSDEETPIQFQVTEEFRLGESHSAPDNGRVQTRKTPFHFQVTAEFR